MQSRTRQAHREGEEGLQEKGCGRDTAMKFHLCLLFCEGSQKM